MVTSSTTIRRYHLQLDTRDCRRVRADHQYQDPNGANPAQVYSSPALMYTITQPLTAVSLNPPTPASPAPVDTAIILSASATGEAGVVYQFLADGVVISDYNASSSCVWTPTADGVYQLTVNAMDLNGVDPTQVITSTAMSRLPCSRWRSLIIIRPLPVKR